MKSIKEFRLKVDRLKVKKNLVLVYLQSKPLTPFSLAATTSRVGILEYV